MSKSKKVILGIATVWPILYMVLSFLFVFSQISFVSSGNQLKEPPTWFFLIFSLHLFTMILIGILLYIYIKNVFKNHRVSQDKKALWAVVLFLGNIISMPIYWYLYIWRGAKQG